MQNQGVQTASSKGRIQVQSVKFAQILLGAVKHTTVELWILCPWTPPVIAWVFHWREENKKEV